MDYLMNMNALALKEMQNNKNPGSEGITIDFSKIFWNDIKTHLINSLYYSFNNENLTTLQKQSNAVGLKNI